MGLLIGEKNFDQAMRKISITGPESSGKTSLTKALASHFKCPYTEEFSREYLNARNGNYDQNDLIEILRGQLELEKRSSMQEADFLFCDSDPLVIWVWSMVKYGEVHHFIDRSWRDELYDLSILVYPDIPWESDPLRENENDRDVLFSVYKEKLRSEKRPFIIVNGSHENRLKQAISSLNEFL